MDIKDQINELINKTAQAALLLRELDDEQESRRQQLANLQKQFHQLQGGVGALRERARLDEQSATDSKNGGGTKTTPATPEPEEGQPTVVNPEESVDP